MEPAPNNGTYGRLHHLLRDPPTIREIPPAGNYSECTFPSTVEQEYRRNQSDCKCDDLEVCLISSYMYVYKITYHFNIYMVCKKNNLYYSHVCCVSLCPPDHYVLPLPFCQNVLPRSIIMICWSLYVLPTYIIMPCLFTEFDGPLYRRTWPETQSDRRWNRKLTCQTFAFRYFATKFRESRCVHFDAAKLCFWIQPHP